MPRWGRITKTVDYKRSTLLADGCYRTKPDTEPEPEDEIVSSLERWQDRRYRLKPTSVWFPARA